MGCGRVGASLALSLEERGHDVAVIDRERSAFRRLGPDFQGRRVHGIGFDRDSLAKAGIDLLGLNPIILFRMPERNRDCMTPFTRCGNGCANSSSKMTPG